VNGYLEFIKQLKAESVPVEGVLLYGLARESMQSEAEHLFALDEGWMKAMAVKIERAGLPVKLSL